MICWLTKISALIGSLLMIITLGGCADSESDFENEYLIRIGASIVTVLDFNEAFEISKTAYPHHLRNNPEDLGKARLRLLNQMTIELVVLERAKGLGIGISDAEIKKAVAEIKSDYPEGVFEETLLEFAVSYKTWEDRLKTRLIMEKVIDIELKDNIVITPEDIARYYEDNFKGEQHDSDLGEHSNDMNEAIIKILRREKLENAYISWIKELKANYIVEINSTQWERITGTKKISAKDLEVGSP
jgi:FKBP-type peptidyl-prolyl cis-trans isomerase (trigger factor)